MTDLRTSPHTVSADYLDRIGVPDATTPDLRTLRRIVCGHATTIPFEALDPFTGREPGLDPDELHAKLVLGRRGGWCFEQNTLLRQNLDALGYRTTGLIARVRWQLPEDAPPTGRSHMLVRVELPEGPYLADVGFGAMTPTGVLALEPGVSQETPLEPFRLLCQDRTWSTQVHLDQWRTLYTFDLTPVPPIDYRMAGWYLAHHPESHFRNTLVAALPGHNHRLTLNDRVFAVRRPGQQTLRREVGGPTELRDVLEQEFGIDTAGVDGLDGRIATLFP